ncbi:MAG: hypothetical protein HLUCCA08_12250 [Rhodobacteraceae bacterium HLUCCA08]|nr:MAG: hypothetical protein HLUCCA08_12250 [Rhodobacteraceae bacterium HLUCCA08]
MSELSELERRIAAGLDRIRAGLDGLQAPQMAAPAPDGPGDADIEALQRQLDEERTANAQLEERVRALKDRQDGRLADLERQVEQARGRATRMDRELQRLRQVNAELRDINSQLRDAVAREVSEPHLVNKAMLAELEALRAARAADVAELDQVMGELTGLLEKEADNAAG